MGCKCRGYCVGVRAYVRVWWGCRDEVYDCVCDRLCLY